MAWKQTLKDELKKAKDAGSLIHEIREWLCGQSPWRDQPIDKVVWVPIEKVVANDYNPNSVAPAEMRLLHTSIQHDGYTQPVVTVYDEDNDVYVVVDGFHRAEVLRRNKDIHEATSGYLPCVVISSDINDRMASTVRHNRARGKHSVAGMSSMVFSMLENGWDDHEVCNELGMEPEELARLKHITGFSKLFSDIDYRRAWTTRNQIRHRKDFEQESGEAADCF